MYQNSENYEISRNKNKNLKAIKLVYERAHYSFIHDISIFWITNDSTWFLRLTLKFIWFK